MSRNAKILIITTYVVLIPLASLIFVFSNSLTANIIILYFAIGFIVAMIFG